MAAQSIEYLDRRCMASYGCNHADALAINGGMPLRSKSSMALRYRQQQRQAMVRGIQWLFTFPEWADMWNRSGHWADRGVTLGKYCMARRGDVGPYHPDNVTIQLSVENSRLALSHRTRIGRRVGSGRGWTFFDGKYQVTLRRKYVGRFDSAEEAHAAYLAAAKAHKDSLSVR